MRITETKLKGAYLVEPELLSDERGFFTTTFCQKRFLEAGLNGTFAQCNISFNKRRGTLRGMHYQIAPMAQPKLVRCARGAVYDVIVDIRPESPTFRRWLSAELTQENCLALFVPAGFAHGFQTLADSSEVYYQMGEFYSPEHGRGVRWNDKAFAIDWPLDNPILNPRDAGYSDFSL